MPNIDENDPNLLVPADTVRNITAQRWAFDTVEIQQGGVLVVQRGSASALHLIVSGQMKLHGTIRFVNASGDSRTIPVRGGDGQPLSLTYTRDNVGGSGATGEGNAKQPGGQGAAGAPEYGGGGGGGATALHTARGSKWLAGADGRGRIGGATGIDCSNPGANGAARDQDDAGGVVVLDVAGSFDGSGGLIDISGSNGAAGEPGRKGKSTGGSTKGCSKQASGGGGGAAGGHGGFLVARLTGGVVEYPEINSASGRGGAGGSALGTPEGEPGQRGRAGAVHWFT